MIICVEKHGESYIFTCDGTHKNISTSLFKSGSWKVGTGGRYLVIGGAKVPVVNGVFPLSGEVTCRLYRDGKDAGIQPRTAEVTINKAGEPIVAGKSSQSSGSPKKPIKFRLYPTHPGGDGSGLSSAYYESQRRMRSFNQAVGRKFRAALMDCTSISDEDLKDRANKAKELIRQYNESVSRGRKVAEPKCLHTELVEFPNLTPGALKDLWDKYGEKLTARCPRCEKTWKVRSSDPVKCQCGVEVPIKTREAFPFAAAMDQLCDFPLNPSPLMELEDNVMGADVSGRGSLTEGWHFYNPKTGEETNPDASFNTIGWHFYDSKTGDEDKRFVCVMEVLAETFGLTVSEKESCFSAIKSTCKNRRTRKYEWHEGWPRGGADSAPPVGYRPRSSCILESPQENENETVASRHLEFGPPIPAEKSGHPKLKKYRGRLRNVTITGYGPLNGTYVVKEPKSYPRWFGETLEGHSHTTFKIVEAAPKCYELQVTMKVAAPKMRDLNASTGVLGIDCDNWRQDGTVVHKATVYDSLSADFAALDYDRDKSNRASREAVRKGTIKHPCSENGLDALRQDVGLLTETTKKRTTELLGKFAPRKLDRYRLPGLLRLKTICEGAVGDVTPAAPNSTRDKLDEGVTSGQLSKDALRGVIGVVQAAAKGIEPLEDTIRKYSATLCSRKDNETDVFAKGIINRHPNHACVVVGEPWIAGMLGNRRAKDETGGGAARDKRDDSAQKNRQAAAPADTKKRILAVCYGYGTTILVLPQANSETECHYCGAPSPSDGEPLRTCAACGNRLAESENKAFNLAKRGRKLLADGKLEPWEKNPFGLPACACLHIPSEGGDAA